MQNAIRTICALRDRSATSSGRRRCTAAASGFDELGRFLDHDGFDGVMLGERGGGHHLEFTRCRTHPVSPAPTAEDLLVFYLPDADEWNQACQRMLESGFTEVAPSNPYWASRGRTFEDPDGYRVVMQQAAWSNGPAS